jgi:hypothetical protein
LLSRAQREIFSAKLQEEFSAEFNLSKVEGPRNNKQFLGRRGDADRDTVRIGELQLTTLTLGQQF